MRLTKGSKRLTERVFQPQRLLLRLHPHSHRVWKLHLWSARASTYNLHVYATIHISEKAEARVTEEARRQGISVEALIEKLINEHIGEGCPPSAAAGGRALLEALQASPYPDIDLTPQRQRLPVRDVVF